MNSSTTLQEEKLRAEIHHLTEVINANEVQSVQRNNDCRVMVSQQDAKIRLMAPRDLITQVENALHQNIRQIEEHQGSVQKFIREQNTKL